MNVELECRGSSAASSGPRHRTRMGLHLRMVQLHRWVDACSVNVIYDIYDIYTYVKSLLDPWAIQHMAMHVMFRRDLNELKVSRKAERPHVRPRVGLSAFAYVYGIFPVVHCVWEYSIYRWAPGCCRRSGPHGLPWRLGGSSLAYTAQPRGRNEANPSLCGTFAHPGLQVGMPWHLPFVKLTEPWKSTCFLWEISWKFAITGDFPWLC